MKRYTYLLLLFMLATPAMFAQLSVKFNGELRTRLEIDELDFNSNSKWQNFINNRARLGAVISNNDDLEFHFRIIDARVFGQEAGVQVNSANLDLNEGYLKLKKGDWEFILGRQEARYNNGRIIAQSDWGNTPITFDGATARYSGKGYRISGFAFRLSDKLAADDSLDHNLLGLFGEFKLQDNLQLNPYLMFDRRSPVERLSRLTLGLNAPGYLGPVVFDIDVAYQTGNIRTTKKETISAFLAAINLEYDFKVTSKAALGAGYAIYSGDKDGTDDKYEVFDNTYATKHAFLGDMDFFRAVPTSTWDLGVTDMYVYYKMALAPWLATKLTGHIFGSAAKYKLASGAESSSYGTEIDLNFVAKYNEYLNFMLGAATFLPGDIFKEKKGPDNAYWMYAGFHLNMSTK
ncbi:MAG: hypothetical protein HBSAPP04_04440 [Ignavibacteriaceae bacterium]|nr:MAG: hypothetical protein EDM75_01625 [Chlorobiota bacterium]GJQ31605.1 MAG: hypothetical protein HBSAPP04_04440 [Ignavibacteriaceae bacterium]